MGTRNIPHQPTTDPSVLMSLSEPVCSLPSVPKWIPPTLPFKHTLTLRCKTVYTSSRLADYMLSGGNLQTDKPERFNHVEKDGWQYITHTHRRTCAPDPSSIDVPQNWTCTNLPRLFLLQMTAFIWGWCCLISQTSHLSSGRLLLSPSPSLSEIGFHFDHHIENIRVERWIWFEMRRPKHLDVLFIFERSSGLLLWQAFEKRTLHFYSVSRCTEINLVSGDNRMRWSIVLKSFFSKIVLQISFYNRSYKITICNISFTFMN